MPLTEASIDLIFAPAYGSSKKNATDIRLAIDALELVVSLEKQFGVTVPNSETAKAALTGLTRALAADWADRGVRVRLLLQGKLDYRIAGVAAQVLYHELQWHGVRIFEYQAAFLHAKVAVVDGIWATVGSSMSTAATTSSSGRATDRSRSRAISSNLCNSDSVSAATINKTQSAPKDLASSN